MFNLQYLFIGHDLFGDLKKKPFGQMIGEIERKKMPPNFAYKWKELWYAINTSKQTWQTGSKNFVKCFNSELKMSNLTYFSYRIRIHPKKVHGQTNIF